MAAKVWKVHPIANVFPRLTGSRYKELSDDVKAHGIRVPVLINKKKDTILDGRTRMNIAHDLKMKDGQVPLEVFNGKPEEEANEIMSRNFHRRDLTDDQRAGIIAKVRGPQLAAEAAKDRSHKGGKGEAKGKTTAERVAAEAKVSEHKARAALTAAKHTPKDLDKVIAGKEKLAAVAKKARAKAGKSPRAKVEKSLQERVEAKFVRFMESFAVTEYREVRRILRELLSKQKD
jgi:hypothetical protein